MAPSALAVITRLRGPESAIYDEGQDVYFISNLNDGLQKRVASVQDRLEVASTAAAIDAFSEPARDHDAAILEMHHAIQLPAGRLLVPGSGTNQVTLHALR